MNEVETYTCILIEWGLGGVGHRATLVKQSLHLSVCMQVYLPMFVRVIFIYIEILTPSVQNRDIVVYLNISGVFTPYGKKCV